MSSNNSRMVEACPEYRSSTKSLFARVRRGTPGRERKAPTAFMRLPLARVGVLGCVQCTWWWLEGNEQVIEGANTLTYTDPQDYIKENNMVVRTMGPHFQCVLNFADNVDEDGGTLIVPQFHHRVKDWTSTNIKLKKPVPFISFGKDGTAQEAALIEESRRVTMREGSVLIWNQTMMHGTSPNYSSRHRLAQFMKVFSRSQTYGAGSNEHVVKSYSRLHRRSVELDSLMRKSGARQLVSNAIGKFVFGIDTLDGGEL